MNNANMQFINVNDIYPHPDNPRKDLGDLSELSESIKANGVMQNLTVVPWVSEITGAAADNRGDLWTVVIGHRRLAAAKRAGLDTVPCVVTEMDHKKQISTMLIENMQRSDLTVLEQAEGMQMMMDLGDSVKEICQKTGFAETTVRHRLKITELDKDTVKKCIKKQIGINDFIKLEKIKDIELRNEVAKLLGTSSFDFKYKNALEKDKWLAKKKEIFEDLLSFATDLTDAEFEKKDYTYVRFIGSYNCESWEVPEDRDDEEYVFAEQHDSFYLYKLKPVEEIKEDDKGPTPEEIEEQRKEDMAKELSRVAYGLRREYILNRKFSYEDASIVIGEYLKQNIEGDLGRAYPYQWINYLILGADDDSFEFDYDVIKEDVEADPVKYLAIAFMASQDGSGENYYNRYPHLHHVSNYDLDIVYDFLIMLGYEMSDDEKQLQDGSHEIFDGTGEDDEE